MIAMCCLIVAFETKEYENVLQVLKHRICDKSSKILVLQLESLSNEVWWFRLVKEIMSLGLLFNEVGKPVSIFFFFLLDTSMCLIEIYLEYVMK